MQFFVLVVWFSSFLGNGVYRCIIDPISSQKPLCVPVMLHRVEVGWCSVLTGEAMNGSASPCVYHMVFCFDELFNMICDYVRDPLQSLAGTVGGL